MIYNKNGESVIDAKTMSNKYVKVYYTYNDTAIYHNDIVPATFSVLGDSYSTYNGYTNVGERAWYRAWYPQNNPNFTDVNQTWWKILERETNLSLLDIDAFSGTCICYDGYDEGIYDQGRKKESFIQRVDMVNYAEYIFVFGGTNDSFVNVGLGNYIYSGWREYDKQYFRPACSYLLYKLKKIYPLSKIVFIKNTDLRQGIEESINTICEHYNVPIVELANIDKDSGHPTRTGMEQIAAQIKTFLDNQEE